MSLHSGKQPISQLADIVVYLSWPKNEQRHGLRFDFGLQLIWWGPVAQVVRAHA
jgi:hypothetical protein